MSRALRRFHIARLKRKRKSYWVGVPDTDHRMLGIIVNTPHPCSCSGCGNERSYEGPTLDERRKDLKEEMFLSLDDIEL